MKRAEIEVPIPCREHLGHIPFLNSLSFSLTLGNLAFSCSHSCKEQEDPNHPPQAAVGAPALTAASLPVKWLSLYTGYWQKGPKPHVPFIHLPAAASC